MMTETVLKEKAMNLLLNQLGVLETELFISSIKNSNFDYTEWHQHLWKDKSIEEIHKMATEFEMKKHKSIEKSHSLGHSFR